MDAETLDLLAGAISDVGAWNWWHVKGDTVQMEFRDVQLYDESKSEREARSTDILAVCFHGHAFAVFLDDMDDDGWHQRFQNDSSLFYPIDACELAFDDAGKAEALLNDYKNKKFIKDFNGLESISSARHILCARCEGDGFVVGEDEVAVVGEKGRYTEEEIETAARKWGEYWRTYWKLRGTDQAYEADFACEATIPIRGD